MQQFYPEFMTTLTRLLQNTASQHPMQRAFTFLDNGSEESLTFSALNDSAQALAKGLLCRVNPGSRVVLLCPPGLSYLKIFFACLYAGIICVPLYPPRLKQRTDRFNRVLISSGAALIVTTDELMPSLTNYFATNEQVIDAQLISVGEISAECNEQPLPIIEEEALAFIQYTSGSTGTPKGVMISHRNIMANLRALKDVTGCTQQDIFVNWLPLFHDLGLVNTVLLPVFLGAHSVLMSPVSFVRRPISWFEAITHYRGTICGAPNFAYELCVEKINTTNLSHIDLSSWKLAFNAAEPVSAATLERFTRAFTCAGFNERAHYPAYGMAEATVFLTGGKHHDGPIVHNFDKGKLKQHRAEKTDVAGQCLVSCGRVPPYHELRIVDPNTLTPLPEGMIGEIWVSGPSIAAGYWELAALTLNTFGATLPGSNRTYLRTSDLGFICDNELYVSGRIKDMIIVRGQNYFPQDIEEIGRNSHEAFVLNASAAFSVSEQRTEKLVLVQEVKASLLNKIDIPAVIACMRQAIAVEFELKVDIVLLRQGTLNKTSSGKVQRSLVKTKYLAGTLDVLAQDAELQDVIETTALHHSFTVVETRLLALWQEILKVPVSYQASDFFALGGDSLDATRLQARIEQAFGIRLTLDSFYENSTIAELAAYISAQATQPDDLDKAWLIPACKSHQSSLSFAQQRLWFLHQMEAQRKVLNLSVVLAIKGPLELDRLVHAFNIITQRHEILRTTYKWQTDNIFQYVHAPLPIHIVPTDLKQSLDPYEHARQLAAEEALLEFDLEEGPIFRLRLLELAHQHYHLVFTIHHIAADAWSMDILINEFKQIYVDPSLGLPESDTTYIDFAQWQTMHYVAGKFDTHRTYWQQQLMGAPALLSLPYDNPRPIRQTFAGAKYSAAIPPEIMGNLQTLSQQQNTTLFVTMLSAFQLQLHRLSDTDDIIVGTDIANRNHGQLSGVLGFFVNQLVLRNSPGTFSLFTELMQSNKSMMFDALAHQDMPFDKLVDALNVERNHSYAPLFQVKFLLNYSPLDALVLPGLQIEQIAQDIKHSQYDLTLSIDFDSSAGFTANFHYNNTLFNHSTIVNLMSDYLLILDAVSRQADVPLTAIPCFHTLQDTYQHWMQGKRHNLGESIGARIEQKAHELPEKTAVVYLDESISYGQLNAEANRLARFLLDLDIAPGSIVGVHFERSINQVITLVALIKAGIGFLPLDPEYPAQRIEYMLNDSMIDYVITASSDHEHLQYYEGGIIALDSNRALIAGESADNLSKHAIDLNEIAYVLYTSGSSGQPKGAQISNRALLNLCCWYERFAAITDTTCLLQPIPLSFDAAIKNIYTPLMAGAKLVLPANGPFDPVIYNNIISAHQVSVINCVPTLLYHILSSAEKNNYKSLCSLKMVALGGESADLGKVKPWLRSEHCYAVLANIYGPTECADISVASKFTPEQLDALEIMPIGKPIDNVDLYVVNSELALMPPGCSGELLIGGMGVGVGYVGQARASSSANKFSDNVFTGHGKLYRTGDRVKWNSDGLLIYLGRMDDQIKINGIRIEIFEIEKSLQELQGISEAVVLPVDDRLIAYLTASGLTPPTANQLQDRLKKCLPAAWIPKAYIFLEKMPLLPNGKIDQKSLKSIPMSEHIDQRDIELPSNDIEQHLVCIWSQVLALNTVGVTENFFQLGGDSMAAVRVVALAQDVNISFSVAEVFETQTIRALALNRGFSTVSAINNNSRNNDKKEQLFDMLSEDDLSILFEEN